MTKSSTRRKATRRMYKRLKKNGQLMKPTKKATYTLPQLDKLQTSIRKPNHVRALSRVIEFETHKPGEFGKWLEDLHIEHFRAGIQERLNREKQNEQNQTDQNPKEQTST